MKSFQHHALNRLIQLFVLKAQTVEFEKAIFVYNTLLLTLKLSSNDRRFTICEDLLHLLNINTYKELCWMATDNPLFVDIKKSYCNEDVVDNN